MKKHRKRYEHPPHLKKGGKKVSESLFFAYVNRCVCVFEREGASIASKILLFQIKLCSKYPLDLNFVQACMPLMTVLFSDNPELGYAISVMRAAIYLYKWFVD